MTTKQLFAILALSTISLSAMAVEGVAVDLQSNGARTRDEVKAELRVALANGEIKHGDLVDFQELVAYRPQSSRLARTEKNDDAVQDITKLERRDTAKSK